MLKIPEAFEGYIILKTENDVKCYALQALELQPAISANLYAPFFASGEYIDRVCDLDFITRSIAYLNELKRHKNLINDIKNKRKELAKLNTAILRERKRLAILKNKK